MELGKCKITIKFYIIIIIHVHVVFTTMTNHRLYYKHLSQGNNSNNASMEELYHGTSRSMESYSAQLFMKQSCDETMNVNINWQIPHYQIL